MRKEHLLIQKVGKDKFEHLQIDIDVKNYSIFSKITLLEFTKHYKERLSKPYFDKPIAYIADQALAGILQSKYKKIICS